MNDRLLVEAMQSRDPGALGAVYEAYADRLYAFCWFLLHSRDAAHVSLRDTLIVAEAHIDKLREPDRFGPWLYAIARIECGRRLPVAGHQPDIPIASHDQDDVDQRIMAWGAVMGLPQLSREFLELRVRHRFSISDLAAVFEVSPREVPVTLAQARGELEAALTAEILAHEGPYGCPDRAVILRDRHGDLTGELRSRLLEHARECEVCGAFRAGAVSPAKVYGMLPLAEPPGPLRLRVMSCFIDPELESYRLFVAARFDEFNASGFPVQRRRAPVWPGLDAVTTGAGMRWRACLRVIAGIAAAIIILAAAVSLLRWAGSTHDHRGGHTAAARATPSARPQPSPHPPGAQLPGGEMPGGEMPGRDPVGGEYATPVSATFPLDGRRSAGPPFAPRDYMRWPLWPPYSPGRPAGSSQSSARPWEKPIDPWRKPADPVPYPTDPSPTPTESVSAARHTPTPVRSGPTPTDSPTPSTPAGETTP